MPDVRHGRDNFMFSIKLLKSSHSGRLHLNSSQHQTWHLVNVTLGCESGRFKPSIILSMKLQHVQGSLHRRSLVLHICKISHYLLWAKTETGELNTCLRWRPTSCRPATGAAADPPPRMIHPSAAQGASNLAQPPESPCSHPHWPLECSSWAVTSSRTHTHPPALVPRHRL